jgi:hypothetical protein
LEGFHDISFFLIAPEIINVLVDDGDESVEENERSAFASAVAATVKLICAEFFLRKILKDGLSYEEAGDEHKKVLFILFGRAFFYRGLLTFFVSCDL